jgi:hypothetical protein
LTSTSTNYLFLSFTIFFSSYCTIKGDEESLPSFGV